MKLYKSMLCVAGMLLATQAWCAENAASASSAGVVPAQTECRGVFSDGTSIAVGNTKNLPDVPGNQNFCDFHTFAWNQFIYLTQSSGSTAPPFLQMAPWYNVLGKSNPGPSAYPGGDTSLKAGTLSKQQAGTDAQLIDVQNGVVLYDIRFNKAMYDGIVQGGLYTKVGYDKACALNNQTGSCTKPIWLPPVDTKSPGAPGAMEIKTAWRDFGAPGKCPSDFFCDGRFGLVGLHIAQKTITHGEWIWASFEHVANTPDCKPNGDAPIANQSPLGSRWSFFSPNTAGQDVMRSRTCSVSAGGPAQCNTNPEGKDGLYKQVNICRTAVLPPGGANPANCKANPNATQATANNEGNVACLNAIYQPKLAGVWKNYKMIGSLWIKGQTGPTVDFRVVGFQTAAPGVKNGEPVGFPHLANTTMETWLQPDSTFYDPFNSNAKQAGCFFCHNLPAKSYSADLSHFPSKLPTPALNKFLKALVPANSSTPVLPASIKRE